MISRSNMRRQLQANGGIMNARQGYGIGSFVKEKLRKLIPNELADIAVKAAPFVAPFQPGIAAAMRGIGRFDQRGSVSDALKQAGGTYAFGKAANYGLSKIPTGAGGTGVSNNATSSAFNNAVKNETVKKKIGPEFMQKTAEKVGGIPGFGKVGELAKQQLLTGTITGGLTYMYEKFIKEEPPQEEGETQGEYMARRDKNVRKKMRGYMDNYLAFDPEYSKLDDAGKDEFVKARSPDSVVQAAEGGLMRTGYAMGTPLPNDPKDTEEFDKILKRIEELQDMGLDLMSATKQAREEAGYNQGGRVGYAIGSPEKQMEAGAPPIIYEGNMDPNQQAGLPSIPGPVQMAEDGPEYDMSERGGFQPLGAQEGKDDVKANLAKNEFVFTADAVRAAGGGSIQQGAQKMYDTMKKLESRVA